MQVGSVTCGRGGMPPEQQQQQHQKEKKRLEREREEVSQCVGLGRNIPSADGWCRKRRKKEGRKKGRKKKWWKNSRSSGVQTVLYMYELPPIYSNPKGKKYVCRVNFDLFRFSHTATRYHVSNRVANDTNNVVVTAAGRPKPQPRVRVWRQVVGISAFINKSSRRQWHPFSSQDFGTFSGANRVPAQRITLRLYRGIISAAGNGWPDANPGQTLQSYSWRCCWAVQQLGPVIEFFMGKMDQQRENIQSHFK